MPQPRSPLSFLRSLLRDIKCPSRYAYPNIVYIRYLLTTFEYRNSWFAMIVPAVLPSVPSWVHIVVSGPSISGARSSACTASERWQALMTSATQWSSLWYSPLLPLSFYCFATHPIYVLGLLQWLHAPWRVLGSWLNNKQWRVEWMSIKFAHPFWLGKEATMSKRFGVPTWSPSVHVLHLVQL